MVKTYESRFPPSHNLGKVTVSFDKFFNTDLFLQLVYKVVKVHTFLLPHVRLMIQLILVRTIYHKHKMTHAHLA